MFEFKFQDEEDYTDLELYRSQNLAFQGHLFKWVSLLYPLFVTVERETTGVILGSKL